MREREHVGLKLRQMLEHKTVCAWCGAFISGNKEETDPSSHGICSKCYKRYFPKIHRIAKEQGKELPKDKQEEAQSRDMAFEDELVTALNAAAKTTKGKPEKAVYEHISQIANESDFDDTTEKPVHAAFDTTIKLSTDVPDSHTAVTFAFLPLTGNYVLLYTHSVNGKDKRVKHWSRPLVVEGLTEIKSNFPPPPADMPLFHKFDPDFHHRLASALAVWVKRSPEVNEEDAMDSLHAILTQVFGLKDAEIKPQGIWHQIWNTHATIAGLRTDIRMFSSPFGSFAVEVQAGSLEGESVWYS